MKEIIDVEEFAKGGKQVPKEMRYQIRIDLNKYTVDRECMTGREILILAQKSPVERFQLNQKQSGGKVTKIGYDQTVCFTEPGVERFMTIPLDQTEG